MNYENKNDYSNESLNIRPVMNTKIEFRIRLLSFNNETKTMVICVNDENKVGLEKVDYMIFDLEDSELIYEKFNFMGSISWYSDSIIRIKRITGVTSAMNTNAGITYYDLVNNENVDPYDIKK